jgi:GntP family gluconate:H+ symporter
LSPLPILAVALAIVITGVLVLRLHAFLTLVVAALAVAALTPASSIERYELTREGVRIDRVTDDGRLLHVTARKGQLAGTVTYDVYRLGQGRQRPARIASATVAPSTLTSAAPVGDVVLVGTPSSGAAIAAGDWITTSTVARTASRLSGETIGRRVAEGFGRTALDIGILIAMASILGGCLMAARGAERIVVSLRRALGPSRTPLAFLGSGFLLGIPMFAEAVFYLLLPLAKAMWQETRKRYVLFVLAIVAGATMTHSLVPPTPGPLFVADAMGISIALMMQQGAIVSAVGALAGYAYALYADGRWGSEVHPVFGGEGAVPVGEDAPIVIKPRLPPLLPSLLPILLPVVLISAESALGTSTYGLPAWFVTAIRVLGDKNLALTVSAGCALALLYVYAPIPLSAGSSPAAQAAARAEAIRRTVREGVVEAGEIILVIAGGGALGAVLRQAGMAELAAATVPEQKLLLLPIAWGITALVRIAQGSATVAMITAVGIIGPIALASQLPYHPVYVAVAIGCGSKIGMWMNDSGFWVISRMSGMTEAQTLKTASAMVFVEGCAGLVVTVALAIAWPLL